MDEDSGTQNANREVCQHITEEDNGRSALRGCVRHAWPGPCHKKEAAGRQGMSGSQRCKEWARSMLTEESSKTRRTSENGLRLAAQMPGKQARLIHLGRIFVILVEKNSELETRDTERGSIGLSSRGDNVVTQNWESALLPRPWDRRPRQWRLAKPLMPTGAWPAMTMSGRMQSRRTSKRTSRVRRLGIALCDEFQRSSRLTGESFVTLLALEIYNRPCVRLI